MEFCEIWRTGTRFAYHPIDLAQARARHDAGETYAVLVPDAASPRVVLQVTPGVGEVAVLWLDPRRQVATEYVFSDQGDPARLFLEQLNQRAADHTATPPPWVTRVRFLTDGTAYHQTLDSRGQAQDLTTAIGPGELESFWEPLPKWGDWSGYARLDRDKPNPDPAAFRL